MKSFHIIASTELSYKKIDFGELIILSLNFLCASLIVFVTFFNESFWYKAPSTSILIGVAIVFLGSVSMLKYHHYLLKLKLNIQNGFRLITHALDGLHLFFAAGIAVFSLLHVSGIVAPPYAAILVLSSAFMVITLLEVFIDFTISRYRVQRDQYLLANLSHDDAGLVPINISSDKRGNYSARLLISFGLGLSQLIVKLGRVKLPFDIDVSADKFLLQEWRSCLPLIDGSRDKIVFSFATIIDAIKIAFTYGVVGRRLNIIKKIL